MHHLPYFFALLKFSIALYALPFQPAECNQYTLKHQAQAARRKQKFQLKYNGNYNYANNYKQNQPRYSAKISVLLW